VKSGYLGVTLMTPVVVKGSMGLFIGSFYAQKILSIDKMSLTSCGHASETLESWCKILKIKENIYAV
jgi:hypothetical protein